VTKDFLLLGSKGYDIWAEAIGGKVKLNHAPPGPERLRVPALPSRRHSDSIANMKMRLHDGPKGLMPAPSEKRFLIGGRK
jgi:hypothetical protein